MSKRQHLDKRAHIVYICVFQIKEFIIILSTYFRALTVTRVPGATTKTQSSGTDPPSVPIIMQILYDTYIDVCKSEQRPIQVGLTLSTESNM